jgi:hypothetical protein
MMVVRMNEGVGRGPDISNTGYGKVAPKDPESY